MKARIVNAEGAIGPGKGYIMENEKEAVPVTKKVLVDRIAEAYPTVTKKDIQGILDATLKTIADALKNREEVRIIGFGKFSVATRSEREGYSPATGEKIVIPAKEYARFKPAKTLLGE